MMKTNVIRAFICLVVLIVAHIVPSSVFAQTSSTCDVDLSQASALLTQAQAKASSGDTAGAMTLLDQVTQALGDIKSRCGGTPPALSQTFTEPNGAFTVSYPAGWINQALPGNSSSQTEERAIFFGNSQAAFDMMKNNKAAPNTQGVIIYVGTAKQVAGQLSAGSSKEINTHMTAMSLLQALIAAQSTNDGRFGTPEKADAIADHQAAQVPFSFIDSKTSSETIKGTLIIEQLSDDQFAIYLSVASPGQEGTATSIARAMAETLKAPAPK